MARSFSSLSSLWAPKPAPTPPPPVAEEPEPPPSVVSVTLQDPLQESAVGLRDREMAKVQFPYPPKWMRLWTVGDALLLLPSLSETSQKLLFDLGPEAVDATLIEFAELFPEEMRRELLAAHSHTAKEANDG